MRSASGRATEMGVRAERPLLLEARERLRELLLRLGAEALEVAHLVARRGRREGRRSTARRARPAASAPPWGRAPGCAGARRRSPGASRGAPRACSTLPVSMSSRILAAVLLPIPWICCSSFARELAEVVRLRRDRLRGALVGADAERLRVALLEHRSARRARGACRARLASCRPSRWLSSLAGVATKEAAEVLSIDGREVRVTHPSKPYFSREAKLTKLDVVRYYLAVARGRARAASATGRSSSSASWTAPRARSSTRSARPRSARRGCAR